MVATLLLLAVLTAEPTVWATGEALGKGADRTFKAKGTKKGATYRLRARGQCTWPVQEVRTVDEEGRESLVKRQKKEAIFGIDFRVKIGAQGHQFLEVGDQKPLETDLQFVADADDVAIRVYDNWESKDEVLCTLDQIRVVRAGS